MFSQPTEEHRFFDDMLGHWKFEHRCDLGPDQPASVSEGRMFAKSYGGMWILLECEGDTPDGQLWHSQFTLGYDIDRQTFVGCFVASMMSHLWIYERGELDASKRILTFHATGPRFDGKGMSSYQDIIEKVNHDHWILRSRIQSDDGSWTEFLEGHQRRIEA